MHYGKPAYFRKMLSADQRELLTSARRVANSALIQGVSCSYIVKRPLRTHTGALIADAVLQAGLNYTSVVAPRIDRIIQQFPNADCISKLIELVQEGTTSHFLNWVHNKKINRFEAIVKLFHREGLECIEDIRCALQHESLCAQLRAIDGVGSKTIDYMACLVGIESVAVDRHVKSFALNAGVANFEYEFLKKVFCCAADLLSMSRRDFDSWVWAKVSRKDTPQLSFQFLHPENVASHIHAQEMISL